MNAEINVSRLFRMMELAAHENTPEPEALVALRKVRAALSSTSMSLQDLVSGPASPPRHAPFMSVTNYRKRIADLEKEVSNLRRDLSVAISNFRRDLAAVEAERDRLKEDLRKAEDALRQAQEAAPIKVEAKGRTYGEFRRLAFARFGTGWDSTFLAFAAHSDPAVTPDMLNAWRDSDHVPDYAFDLLNSMSMFRVSTDWTVEKLVWIINAMHRRLSPRGGLPVRDLVQQFQAAWGHSITFAAARQVLHRLRDKAGEGLNPDECKVLKTMGGASMNEDDCERAAIELSKRIGRRVRVRDVRFAVAKLRTGLL